MKRVRPRARSGERSHGELSQREKAKSEYGSAARRCSASARLHPKPHQYGTIACHTHEITYCSQYLAQNLLVDSATGSPIVIEFLDAPPPLCRTDVIISERYVARGRRRLAG